VAEVRGLLLSHIVKVSIRTIRLNRNNKHDIVLRFSPFSLFRGEGKSQNIWIYLFKITRV
jgi:hypothetical protein